MELLAFTTNMPPFLLPLFNYLTFFSLWIVINTDFKSNFGHTRTQKCFYRLYTIDTEWLKTNNGLTYHKGAVRVCVYYAHWSFFKQCRLIITVLTGARDSNFWWIKTNHRPNGISDEILLYLMKRMYKLENFRAKKEFIWVET